MIRTCSKLFNLSCLKNVRKLHLSKSFNGEAYDGPGKTTVTILNKGEEDMLLIDGCHQAGFHLSNGLTIIGPMAIFPRTLLSWDIESAKEINESSLSLFTVLVPKLDLLILGLEDVYDFKYSRSLKELCINKNLRVEILTVKQACSAYNFVVLDGMFAGAGLIPPIQDTFYKVNVPGISYKENKQSIVYADPDLKYM